HNTVTNKPPATTRGFRSDQLPSSETARESDDLAGYLTDGFLPASGADADNSYALAFSFDFDTSSASSFTITSIHRTSNATVTETACEITCE
ncbi:MAG: hypothetical protein QM662_17780, partial [Gordonia sp. (in: high G+C Gram-positive bacteria)]